MCGHIRLTIDGKTVESMESMTVLEAAQHSDIYIPAICAHPSDSPFACRLCIVAVDGIPDPVTACTTPVANGMVVWTDSPRIQRLRRRNLTRILREHPNACLNCSRVEPCDGSQCNRKTSYTWRCVTCAKNERCELQKAARFIKLDQIPIPYTDKELPIDMEEPIFERDNNLCIKCGQCVTVCHEVCGVGAISFTYQDNQATVEPTSGSLKESGCRFCGACVEVCPTAALMERSDKQEPWVSREVALVPCRSACPAGVDVPRYVRLIAQGKFAEAAAVIREKVPFPAVLGHVCQHFCEIKCRRGELNEPVAIRSLKRFAAEHDVGLWRSSLVADKATGKRVAIVGSGPAGLTAAYYLAKLGYSVTVFEALSKAGGMMRIGIPRFMLPEEVLDREINDALSLGIDLRLNSRLQKIDALFTEGYQAIFLAVGAHNSLKPDIPGEELKGVYYGVAFLRDVNLGKEVKVGQNVAVVGGGNVAIDAARTASRLGAKGVAIVYRRSRQEMPASEEGIEGAEHEGIKIHYLANPVKILGKNGSVVGMKCIRMELGAPDASGRRRPVPVESSEFVIDADMVIPAIGQTPDLTFLPRDGIHVSRQGTLEVDPLSLMTGRPGVFAGGDAITGPASIIEAVASGRKAAISIDKYLGGNGLIDEVLTEVEQPNPWLGREEGFSDKARAQMPSLPLEQRLNNFKKVELGFNEKMAIAEAKRCLQCDLRLQILWQTSLPIKAKSILNLKQ